MADLREAWNATATAAGATCTATKAAVSGKRHYVFGFAISADTAGATWALKHGTTTVAQGSLAANETVTMASPIPLCVGDLNEAVSLTVASATSYCAATIWGLTYHSSV